MTTDHLQPRIVAAIGETPSRIPVLLGPCGSGRTRALRQVGAALAPGASQYVDLERVTSTPERFLARLVADTPFIIPAARTVPAGPGEAYRQALAFFTAARTRDGGPATFLLDEALELRMFESFPGLSGALDDTLAAFASCGNRFVLATKFETRALRALRHASDRYLALHAPPVPTSAVTADLMHAPGLRSDEAEDTARVVVALTEGRGAYVAAILRVLAGTAGRAHDPVEALATLLAPGGGLAARCRFSYEFRLHRARGYGALKAVLGILAEEEPLTLTEIAIRLQRTPGSTRDYLGWLEDVDLVGAHRKRYSVADPLLRLWIGLYSESTPPDEGRVSDAVRRYAVARLSAGSAAEA